MSDTDPIILLIYTAGATLGILGAAATALALAIRYDKKHTKP